jgi:DNA-binding ferritin-like protein
MEHNNPIVGQFVSTLFASRTQAHIFHLQATGEGSLAIHKALNDYYDEIVGITDGMAESYQGKYGIITGYGNIALQEFQNCESVIMFFETLCMYVEKSREMICQDSYIQNQIDEIVALIKSTIYKLRFLK